MELDALLVFLVALTVSGFIAYKAIQWTYYEEIGAGLTAAFLAFAVVVFLVISNYNALRNMNWFDRAEVDRASGDISKATADSLVSIQNEAERQRESLRVFIQNIKDWFGTTSDRVQKANETAKQALEVAKLTAAQTERLSYLQVHAVWGILIDDFFQIEQYLRRWEEQNQLKRGGQSANSLEDLEDMLGSLGKEMQLPESIRELYLKRHRKYEILERFKDEFASLAKGFSPTDFSLPDAPEFPVSHPSFKEHADGSSSE